MACAPAFQSRSGPAPRRTCQWTWKPRNRTVHTCSGSRWSRNSYAGSICRPRICLPIVRSACKPQQGEGVPEVTSAPGAPRCAVPLRTRAQCCKEPVKEESDIMLNLFLSINFDRTLGESTVPYELEDL